jgi:hypothetical protein
MKISRLIGSSLRPEPRGVAEIWVKMAKTRIEAFMLMTSYEAGVLTSLIA